MKIIIDTTTCAATAAGLLSPICVRGATPSAFMPDEADRAHDDRNDEILPFACSGGGGFVRAAP